MLLIISVCLVGGVTLFGLLIRASWSNEKRLAYERQYGDVPVLRVLAYFAGTTLCCWLSLLCFSIALWGL